MAENKIIEINGVKVEVDLTTVKVVNQYKVGDNVKVLKKDYGDSYQVYNGVIAEFINFNELPTIVVAYVNNGYQSCGLNFLYINKNTAGVELAPICRHEIKIDKQSVVTKMQNEIESKERELAELKARRDYFVSNFARYFAEVE